MSTQFRAGTNYKYFAKPLNAEFEAEIKKKKKEKAKAGGAVKKKKII